MEFDFESLAFDPDPRIRKMSLEDPEDPIIRMIEMALEDPDPRIRKMILEDPDPRIRKIALEAGSRQSQHVTSGGQQSHPIDHSQSQYERMILTAKRNIESRNDSLRFSENAAADYASNFNQIISSVVDQVSKTILQQLQPIVQNQFQSNNDYANPLLVGESNRYAYAPTNAVVPTITPTPTALPSVPPQGPHPSSLITSSKDSGKEITMGVVTQIEGTFGMVNQEIFFQLSTVTGAMPKLGDKVVVEAEKVTGMPFKFHAKRVQLVSRDLLSEESEIRAKVMESALMHMQQNGNIMTSQNSMPGGISGLSSTSPLKSILKKAAPPPPIISKKTAAVSNMTNVSKAPEFMSERVERESSAEPFKDYNHQSEFHSSAATSPLYQNYDSLVTQIGRNASLAQNYSDFLSSIGSFEATRKESGPPITASVSKEKHRSKISKKKRRKVSQSPKRKTKSKRKSSKTRHRSRSSSSDSSSSTDSSSSSGSSSSSEDSSDSSDSSRSPSPSSTKKSVKSKAKLLSKSKIKDRNNQRRSRSRSRDRKRSSENHDKRRARSRTHSRSRDRESSAKSKVHSSSRSQEGKDNSKRVSSTSRNRELSSKSKRSRSRSRSRSKSRQTSRRRKSVTPKRSSSSKSNTKKHRSKSPKPKSKPTISQNAANNSTLISKSSDTLFNPIIVKTERPSRSKSPEPKSKQTSQNVTNKSTPIPKSTETRFNPSIVKTERLSKSPPVSITPVIAVDPPTQTPTTIPAKPLEKQRSTAEKAAAKAKMLKHLKSQQSQLETAEKKKTIQDKQEAQTQKMLNVLRKKIQLKQKAEQPLSTLTTVPTKSLDEVTKEEISSGVNEEEAKKEQRRGEIIDRIKQIQKNLQAKEVFKWLPPGTQPPPPPPVVNKVTVPSSTSITNQTHLQASQQGLPPPLPPTLIPIPIPPIPPQVINFPPPLPIMNIYTKSVQTNNPKLNEPDVNNLKQNAFLDSNSSAKVPDKGLLQSQIEKQSEEFKAFKKHKSDGYNNSAPPPRVHRRPRSRSPVRHPRGPPPGPRPLMPPLPYGAPFRPIPRPLFYSGMEPFPPPYGPSRFHHSRVPLNPSREPIVRIRRDPYSDN